ncbi:tetratricopeptide repeat protein [Aquimarina macrocephali]|uniref:tetratricopeptide repeat protein n=1 Tax=Aquimarina macrocephali TaxID=666563 RepID=UPI0004654FB9|nr:tetratricopeptide repeat protein [Aquimarina macrocephali]
MPYFLIIALQGFCIYHAIKNKNNYYWFFVIIFLPVLGSVIYLLTQVFSKKDLDVVQDEIVNVINPTKKIDDLQKQLDFAETFQNRVNLADALLEIKDYPNAINEYEVALSTNYDEDAGVVKKLIEGYYQTKNYDKVIFCAEKINAKPDFKGSRSQFLYGLALEEIGQSEKAEDNLRQIDQRYSNYQERYILAQFLVEKGKNEEAKEILSEILTESQHMSKPNRSKYQGVVNDVKKLASSL